MYLPITILPVVWVIACGDPHEAAVVQIVVREFRWLREADGSVRWQDEKDGNNRRRQVLTLQPKVYRALPPAVQNAIFPPEEQNVKWQHVWPRTRDAIGELASMKAITCCDHQTPRNQMSAQFVGERLHYFAVLAANGTLQKAFINEEKDWRRVFQPARQLYPDSKVDQVLGVYVDQQNVEASDQAVAVCATVLQGRYLLNSLVSGTRRTGFLNMRLLRSEVPLMRNVDGQNCSQGRPCQLWNRTADTNRIGFACPHGRRFAPFEQTANESEKAFARSIEDGARLYGIPLESLSSIVGFRLDVPGDAAIPVHFWPGRGLNTGTLWKSYRNETVIVLLYTAMPF
eukprot:g49651.t1